MSDELVELKATVAARGPAWSAAMDAYLERIGDRSVWSATRHVIPPMLKIAGDPDTFRELILGVADVMTICDDHRFEQQAVPVCALNDALFERPNAMRQIIAGARRLAELKIEPGWFVQKIVRPLAAAAPNDADFITAWDSLVEIGCGMARDGQYPGYPIASGLSALVERNDLAALAQWCPVLATLARAAKDGVYGLFEYALPGLAQGQLDASDTTDALRLAIAMYDHGQNPGPTLRALATPLQLDLATKLAKAGLDPALVITNGLEVFDALGWLDDDGARLAQLAIAMHEGGLRTLLWDDGIPMVLSLERNFDGLGLRGLELIEQMVAHDIEPAILFRWTLPRTLGFLRPVWAAAELLEFASGLVEIGVAPEPAIQSAARPLVELAQDVEDFRRLAKAVVALVARLHALGVDHREVLFSDVAHLAQAGKESQTFGELLEAFAQLLATWTELGLDPTALLKTALPAAAREAASRPWVLAIALRTATRLGREGRADQAVALLEVGVKTATQLQPGEAAAFETALASIEARYAALPRELTEHASLAAGIIAGTDVEKLDRALAMIAETKPDLAIAAALPDLARMAKTTEGLGTLITVASTLGCSVRTIAIAAQVCKSPDDGERVLRALRAWLGSDEARELTLDRIGTLARFTTPATLVPVIELLHAALADQTERRLLLELLDHARDEATLREMCARLAPLLRDARPPLLDGLYRAKELLARNWLAWRYLVGPSLVTAKQHAGGLLHAVAWLRVENEADAAVVRDLITQRGLRAVDLIQQLVLPALAQRVMPSLAAHRELLDRYLDEVGFADAEVYAHFVRIASDGDRATQASRIAALRAEIRELTAAIRTGDVTPAQRAHALFGVALQHVFPAAVTATRRMWERLVEVMPDRPGDVTALWPAGHRAPLEVAEGAWQLAPGTHDLSAFGWLARVRPVDDAEARPLDVLGWDLLTAWSEGRLAREPLRSELARALLAHEEQLPSSATDSASQLLAIRALAGDRLSALVELAVVAARAQDPDRADRLIQTRLAPAPRIGPGLVKAIARTLDGTDVEKRLRGQLANFELPDDPVAVLRAAPDLAAALHALPAKRVAIEPGKELGRIHADLVGQDLAEMTATIATALEYRASTQTLAIDVELTKRQVHSPIGLTAGVCVATDEELWKQPGFSHLALWLDGVCMGNVHLLVVEEAGQRYLALPGINPSFALLERVEAELVLKALLERITSLAREANLAGVWIPTSPSIHSNRRAIHDCITALKLPVRRTQGHAFSYSPYAYRIDNVFELS